MKQKSICINNKILSYYESKADGIPIVFIHGLLSSSAIFLRQLIDSSLSYNFRLVALDLMGHGNSERSGNPVSDYSLSGQCKWLIDFSKALNLSGAVYVGHNIGGNIILEAFENLESPRGLVLLGSLPFSENVLSGGGYYNFPLQQTFNSIDAHQVACLLTKDETKYPSFIPGIIQKTDARFNQYFLKSLAGGKNNQLKLVENLNVPVALFFGENDQIVNTKNIELTGFFNGNYQIQKISDSGHIFFYEDPLEFNINLADYLKRAL